ncbi:MAG TPA: hypothetical protein VJ724_02445 [Tahibacter sp.]|nr:hypothetical protein [Tahibacter sp.]
MLPAGISPAPLSPLAQAFESSVNLGQLVRELTPRAAAGDAQAARVVAQALEECAILGLRRGGADGFEASAGSMPANRRNAALAHVARYRERCTELVNAEKITPERLRETVHAGSLGNDLVDEARRLVDGASTMSDAQIRDTLRRIVQSRDAQAIAAMSDAMAQRHDDRDSEPFGPRSGSDIHAWAWRFVACDLGMPCGPASAQVRHACLFLGMCVPGDYREVARFYYLTPWAFELAIRQEREILQDIANGNIDQIFP